ncbi:hypothetical protein FisN_1Lh407 [Fistulifera solaris]|uniref:Uncharacterized protein n=1 Tax=Fistulifera solaris TaxID=1519565 RepID=A0A1Z5K3W0_FISSO|nr:hypothetical protein FisN_1Lh407 [Fistulifera solaris]|eukprot:GAX20934.1 hypothetical protein FisN_1Lh407 [Fistulifera solaris]
MSPFRAQGLKTVLTHVAIGMGSASFWRGAWYVLDDHLFPENKEYSALASFGLGTLGMAASQGLVARMENFAKMEKYPVRLSLLRFGALYSIAVSCVLVWRGTWIGWDCLYARMHPLIAENERKTETINATDPGHATKSGFLSHVAACTILMGTGFFASVLAPPAAASVIRDLAVSTGGKVYNGPAQSVARQFLGRVVAPTRSVHNNATRRNVK